MYIAALPAGLTLKKYPTGNPRGNTDERKKAKKPTGRMKKSGEWAGLKKPWLMPLQDRFLFGY
jgi:hypothetical protein